MCEREYDALTVLLYTVFEAPLLGRQVVVFDLGRANIRVVARTSREDAGGDEGDSKGAADGGDTVGDDDGAFLSPKRQEVVMEIPEKRSQAHVQLSVVSYSPGEMGSNIPASVLIQGLLLG